MSETIYTSARRGFSDFSPVKKDDGNKENDLPILTLIQFSKAPFLTFGTVKLGTSKSAVLQIENPTEDAEAEVTIEKIPSSKGFSVDHSAFTIQVCSSLTDFLFMKGRYSHTYGPCPTESANQAV